MCRNERQANEALAARRTRAAWMNPAPQRGMARATRRAHCACDSILAAVLVCVVVALALGVI